MRVLEVVRSHGKPKERNKPVRSRSRDSARGDQRGEGDLAGENGAEDRRTEEEHDRHSIPGLLRVIDTPDPV